MEEMNGMQGTYDTGSTTTAAYMQDSRPNPEEEIRSARKHFSKLGLMFFLGTIIVNVVQIIALNIAKAINPAWVEDPNISILLAILPMYLLGMPVMIALIKRIPATPPEQHHMKAGHFVLSVIMCYALTLVSNVVGLVVTFIVGLLKGGFVNNEMVSLTTSTNVFLLFVFTVCCAPFYEEYIFRKLIVDRTVRYGQGVAVIVSGLMFGLFHGNFNQFIYAFTFGMFLAFLYVKTGKLKVTIGIHMIVNFVGSVIVPLLVNLIDLDGYMQLINEGMDPDAMMAYLSENMVGWVLYFCFMCCVFAIVITGVVLLIVFLAKKRFRLAPGQIVIPKGKRFRTVFLNLGMILFILFWIVVIIMQLFS